MPKRIYANEAHQAQLQSSLADGGSETEIEVDTTEGWPSPGTGEIAIGAIDHGDQSLIELFSYTGTGTSPIRFTGVTRGLDGTSKPAHDVGARVRHTGSARDLISAQMDSDSIDDAPGRNLDDAAWTVSSARPAWVAYTVGIVCQENEHGEIDLLVDGTAVGRHRLNNTNTAAVRTDSQLVALVPPGHTVQVTTNARNGAPAFSLTHEREMTL